MRRSRRVRWRGGPLVGMLVACSMASAACAGGGRNEPRDASSGDRPITLMEGGPDAPLTDGNRNMQDGGQCVPPNPMPWDGMGVACSESLLECASQCSEGDEACINNCISADPRGEDCVACLNAQVTYCISMNCSSQWSGLASCANDNCCASASSGDELTACTEMQCSSQLSTLQSCAEGIADGCQGAQRDCFPCFPSMISEWTDPPPCSADLLTCLGACSPMDTSCPDRCFAMQPESCQACWISQTLRCINANGCQSQWSAFASCVNDNCCGPGAGGDSDACLTSQCGSQQNNFNSCAQGVLNMPNGPCVNATDVCVQSGGGGGG